MRIVDRIEINYFTSLYSLNLSNANINVFVGGNDVGKSNVLKTLNLFSTILPTSIRISIFFVTCFAFASTRHDQPKVALLSGNELPSNNFLSWKSLPPRFAIKRSWNRYSRQPSDTVPKEIPERTIGGFLNRIAFHYVPAVRSRDLFSHYLRILHDALIDDERAEVRDASNALMDAINKSTQEMSDDIATGLGVKRTIKVPEDLRQPVRRFRFCDRF